jgi:glyoxylate/hydroxypyruvate reductase A
MRLHIQNPADTPLPITVEEWDAVARRNPDVASRFEVSIGFEEKDLDLYLPEVEILVTWVDVAKERFVVGSLPGSAPRLKVIYCNSTGIDRLAPFHWLPEGVALVNNSGVQSKKAGEFAIMALLMLQNRMPALIAGQQTCAWNFLYGSTLQGRTLGIVGMGSIGGEVARQARHFGMHIIGVRSSSASHPECDETVSVTDLNGILPRVDDLLLACPLTEQTRNLLSRQRVALLRKGARIVNIARGAVWDQDAVCDALDAGQLDSAFTDVTVPEPLPSDHRLWRTPNLIITPHVAADDQKHHNENTLDLLLANLKEFLEGRPIPNRIDPRKGY